MNSPPKNLTEWIEIATCGLIVPAKERIRQEVEAHFADAVSRGQIDGLTIADAQAAALLELGEPADAVKEFRKKHLTEAEVKRLWRIEASYRKWISSPAWLLSLVYGVIMFLTTGENQKLTHVIVGSWFVAWFFESIVVLWHFRQQSFSAESLRKLIAVDVVFACITLGACALLVFLQAGSFWAYLFLAILTIHVARRMRLSMKLRNAEQIPPKPQAAL